MMANGILTLILIHSLSNIAARYLLLRINDNSEDINDGYRGGQASTNRTETKGNQKFYPVEITDITLKSLNINYHEVIEIYNDITI